VEIDQAPGGVDSAISRTNREMITLLALFVLAFFVLLQLTFWIGVRQFAAGHRRLLHLYTRGDQIRSSLDLHEVVTHVSRAATLLARGTHGLVALYDETNGDMMLRATYEHATGAIAHHQRAVEEWFLRRCVATNTTIVTSQPSSAYRQFFGPEIDGGGQMALVCVPVSLRDRVVGVVAVARRADGRRGGFAATEVQGVEELAGQAVMAVEQALLFAKVRSYADEIELSYDATLKALMAALDAKDEATEGHCERVAKLTLHLARQMGIPQEQMLDIERGALLHDVGKIGVPDAVLKKPKELNDMEWEAMRKHPLLAGLMVSKIGFLEGALPILLYHHERYDGAGYPFGLTADKIPLEARIFSIVDAYDAMTSNRPYREAMTHEAAMAEVAANSGAQFDPDVVAAFEHLMETRPELRHHGSHQLPAEHDEHDQERPGAAAAEDAA
jgi:HD-GYP domain-containing protein (c-di-GMP phosphodiesterase class II)